jgi:hypothetical protein
MVKRSYLPIILTVLFLIPIVSFASNTKITEDRVKAKITRLSMPFIENTGQIESKDVSFYAKTFWGTVFITKNGEIVYSLPESVSPVTASDEVPTQFPSKGIALKEKLLGGNVKDVKGEGESITRVSYFKGKDSSKWRSNISTHNFVSLGEVYTGIELTCLPQFGPNFDARERLITDCPRIIA